MYTSNNALWFVVYKEKVTGLCNISTTKIIFNENSEFDIIASICTRKGNKIV